MNIYGKEYKNLDFKNYKIQQKFLLKAYIKKLLNDSNIINNQDLREVLKSLLDNVENLDFKSLSERIQYISNIEYYLSDNKLTSEIFADTFQDIINKSQELVTRKFPKFSVGIGALFANLSQILSQANKSRHNYIHKLTSIMDGDFDRSLQSNNNNHWVSLGEGLLYTSISFAYIYIINYYYGNMEKEDEKDNLKRKLDDEVAIPWEIPTQNKELKDVVNNDFIINRKKFKSIQIEPESDENTAMDAFPLELIIDGAEIEPSKQSDIDVLVNPDKPPDLGRISVDTQKWRNVAPDKGANLEDIINNHSAYRGDDTNERDETMSQPEDVVRTLPDRDVPINFEEIFSPYTMDPLQDTLLDRNDTIDPDCREKARNAVNETITSDPKELRVSGKDSFSSDRNEKFDDVNKTITSNTKELIVSDKESFSSDRKEKFDNVNETITSDPKELIASDKESFLSDRKEKVDDVNETITSDPKELDAVNETITSDPKEVIASDKESFSSDRKEKFDDVNETITSDPKELRVSGKEKLDAVNETITSDPKELIVSGKEAFLSDRKEKFDDVNKTITSDAKDSVISDKESFSSNKKETIEAVNEPITPDARESIVSGKESFLSDRQETIDSVNIPSDTKESTVSVKEYILSDREEMINAVIETITSNPKESIVSGKEYILSDREATINAVIGTIASDPKESFLSDREEKIDAVHESLKETIESAKEKINSSKESFLPNETETIESDKEKLLPYREETINSTRDTLSSEREEKIHSIKDTPLLDQSETINLTEKTIIPDKPESIVEIISPVRGKVKKNKNRKIEKK